MFENGMILWLPASCSEHSPVGMNTGNSLLMIMIAVWAYTVLLA